MPNVIVGCKLPHGLIIKTGGKSAILNGANSSKIIGGYGLTPVDKDFFDAWKAEYATFSPLKDGLIFEQANERSAASQAKEQEEIKSGLEPLDLDKPAPGIKPEAYDGKPADKED
jgi:hypothetical protein